MNNTLDFLNKFKKPLPGYFKSSLIIIGIIILYCVIVSLMMIRANKKKDTKNKFLLLNIVLVKKFNKFIKDNIGKHWKVVAPSVLTIGIYIGLGNISGLFGLKPPTSYTSITVSLAIFAMATVQITGIVSRKFRHIKTLFEPIPFMFPINFIGEFTPIISMSLRLFGNITAGVIILGLVYGFLGWMGPIITPALHLIFDVAFGFIQMMVFTTLTVIFASNKLEVGDVDPEELNELLLKKEEKRKKKELKKQSKLEKRKGII